MSEITKVKVDPLDGGEWWLVTWSDGSVDRVHCSHAWVEKEYVEYRKNKTSESWEILKQVSIVIVFVIANIWLGVNGIGYLSPLFGGYSEDSSVCRYSPDQCE